MIITSILSSEEKKMLDTLVSQIMEGELQQTQELIKNCNNKYQLAKTHSTLLKDWEKTKAKMENNLSIGKLPPGTSANFYKSLIDETQKMMDAKFETIREAFSLKFGESIYNYLGKDGKIKKFFGIF